MLVLVALVTAGVVIGAGAAPNARVKSAATLIVSGIRVAYVRSSATSKPMRLVFDIDHSTLMLEEADKPMLVRRDDETPAAGAQAATPQEQEALAQAEKIVKGPRPARPVFKGVKALGFESDDPAKGRELGSGVRIRRFDVAHSKEPQYEGRGYLYFWSGGMTERAAIQIARSGSDETQLTVVVSPLMGKATIVGGAKTIDAEREDKGEREDRGF
ncbi:MAG: prepilin-type cleavage/methylation domain-containing protein [Deltaproteobacteria bacterium]|nr:prepilin-type cleavage/methylation domain-containing protein [Deltaproteobacteria bacterium]